MQAAYRGDRAQMMRNARRIGRLMVTVSRSMDRLQAKVELELTLAGATAADWINGGLQVADSKERINRRLNEFNEKQIAAFSRRHRRCECCVAGSVHTSAKKG